MATRAVSYHTLACDAEGCEATFGRDTYYPSVIEVRAVAYAAGWRFPPKLKRTGEQSTTVSDVCPEHVAGWAEQPALDTWKNRRRTDGR